MTRDASGRAGDGRGGATGIEADLETVITLILRGLAAH